MYPERPKLSDVGNTAASRPPSAPSLTVSVLGFSPRRRARPRLTLPGLPLRLCGRIPVCVLSGRLAGVAEGRPGWEVRVSSWFQR